MSGWIGFNTAVSGLLASQRSLHTTNHNISNANTEGYSRQQVVQKSASPMSLPGIGMLGMGTSIDEIKRVRDSYVDFKYWLENAPLGEWEVKRENLVELEKVFNEPSDSSFRQYLDDFFTALDTLSKNPSDYSHRSLVRETAEALTSHLNETAGRLYKMQEEINFAISTKVDQINDLAESIRNLNKQIYGLELDGTKANDLRDKRALLVDKLSKIVNVQVNEDDQGRYTVSIGGTTLVHHLEVRKIEYAGKSKGQDPNPVEVKWDNGQSVSIKSGEIKGLIDLINGEGESGSYRGVPFYINRLDQFAAKFAERMNNVHYNNKGLNKAENIYMFTIDGKDSASFVPGTDEVKAHNISVSKDILDNLDNIATAENHNEPESNEGVLELIDLREDKMFFDDPTNPPQGTPDDFIKSVLSTLAVDSQHADRMNNNQSVIMENIELKRESESGVSIDEEMSNMVKFQHSYNAAARMITTMDKIYDVTINRLGLVGR
ncbi:flagellar hook-associated protein FlgK [Caldisalinibacter kiritimatiensis]|uniref:Flagellar hook-associated protein 1 n=1 Tax=Caldisalinibacter kiritimatiensis TaxID=1304284 RepID=R1AQI9_9FIRM|nr:flagellar hook-associated protein FlgK [Caldisalinibacter kiritimatiensis]EOC99392.1 Flagellar hook-associated protein FlgK [Caldisalinibacter kiritimatiensis]